MKILLLFDDDVCVRHDLLELYRTPMGEAASPIVDADAPTLASSGGGGSCRRVWGTYTRVVGIAAVQLPQ